MLVPNTLLGRALREGLSREAAQRTAPRPTLVLPRILVLHDWVQGFDLRTGSARSETQRRVELFNGLKTTAWLTQRMGAQSGQLWGLARQLIDLCDGLTLGLAQPGAGQTPAIEARFLAALKGSYRDRAWQVCSEEAELVLGIWRSTFAQDDAPALLLRGLERLAQVAPVRLCVIAPLQLEPYMESFLERYAQRQKVLRLEVDVSASLAPVPALHAAWPELTAAPSAPAEPLRERARRLAQSEPIRHIRLLRHNSLEDEAASAAQTVLDWLAEGRQNIALVALDRLTARRVRALLERAQVLVRDEAGWKFSTATVAGSLMRWLQMVHPDENGIEASVLLDWIKSPHALGDVAGKESVVAEVELAIRRDNVVRGWPRIAAAVEHARTVVSQSGPQSGPQSVATGAGEPSPIGRRADSLSCAVALVERLRRSAVPLRGRQSLAAHFGWLTEVLEVTQMAPSFRTDPVGAALLALLESLAGELRPGGAQPGFTFSEWRDFVADALENTTFREQTIDSAVVTTSLAGAALRAFDAALVLGADAAHFPGQMGDALFLNASLRAQLGLSDQASEQRLELTQLALLLVATPQVTVTWRSLVERHPNPVAGAIQRLSMLHASAFGDSLERRWDWPREAAAVRRSVRPAPAAPARVPGAVSASAYNTFLSCPYRFFVRHMLDLAPLEEIREDVEKRDYGELVHRILDRFHRLRARPGDRGEALALLEQVSAEVFASSVGANAAYLGYQARWKTLTSSYIDWWIERDDEGWQFSRSEFSLERPVELAAGRAIRLKGRIDRLDRLEPLDPLDRQSGRIAIVDYKARDKRLLQRSLREAGEDVQLPFYRLLLHETKRVEAGYLSVDREKVAWIEEPFDLDGLADAVLVRLRRDFDRLYARWGLPANGVESACKRCESRGLCRKGQWSDDEVPSVRASGAAAR